MRKTIFTDNDYESIARSIVIGVTVGSVIGIFLYKTVLFFAIGGLIGILLGIFSIYRKTNKA